VPFSYDTNVAHGVTYIATVRPLWALRTSRSRNGVSPREPHLLVNGLGFPECPRWHNGVLWVSDIMTRQILNVGADGSTTVFAELPHRPMGLGFLADGDILVVSMEDCRLLRYRDGNSTVLADLASITVGLLNDLVVDGSGRAYLSNTGRKLGLGDRKPANIVTFAAGEPPRVVASGLQLSNGMVVTPDRRTLIVAETEGARLSAFTIADDGSLVDQRVFASLPGHIPNGICGDAEGAVWVSSHNGGFLRVLEGGEIADRVEVAGNSARMATACALGGVDGRQLFMASCDQLPSHADFLANVERSGRVDVVTVDVPGAGWP
jgi:sugar lactone lactonase YvrE